MSTEVKSRSALVLGVYKKKDTEPTYTSSTSKYLEQNPELKSRLPNILGSKFDKGATRLLYDQKDANVLCLTNLGNSAQEKYDEIEEVFVNREDVRSSISKSVKALAEQSVTHVTVDGCGDPQAVAEGAVLSNYTFDEFKTVKNPALDINPLDLSSNALDQWNTGKAMAEAQNFSRWLMETPSNFMTPTKFSQVAKEVLPASCEVVAHDKTWIEKENMNAYLAVSQGSAEPPVFVEVTYKGDKSNTDHIALVGKGVTFDAGGISIKPSLNMDAMRADMGGAACVLGTMLGLSKLQLPVNVKAYIPLAENMPSGTAIKPGDVVTSRSGKTIQIDNTDAEGRLLLADALHYASSHKPVCMVDMATLTGAMVVALGAGAAGTFTNSSTLFTALHESAKHTGDRLWRMPLYQLYTSQMNKAPLADLNNIGGGGKGGSCTAAAFLKEFVTCNHWAHIDIAGVMSNTDEVPYLSKGMAGRPTRTLIDFFIKFKLSTFTK